MMLAQWMMPNRSICVYCGSQAGLDPDYNTAGSTLGRAIAGNGIRLVYGGGTGGIMGKVAASVIQAGGQVTGIIPEFLQQREAGEGEALALDELIVTADMHSRKHAMFDRSGAFVALPGGLGTLEEIVEILTWAQLGRHRRPMVLANINGFWNPLLQLLEHMNDEGFLHSHHLIKPLVVDTADAIVPRIIAAWTDADGDGGDPHIIGKM